MKKLCALVPLALLVAACGQKSTAASSTGTQPAACATDPRAESYYVGLTNTSQDGAVKVKYLDANPAPPTKGINAWSISVEDEAGKPMDGATVTVKTYMPDHGHGSSVIPDVADKGGGDYDVTDVDLFMPGIWQITYTITPGAGAPKSVVFTFCVDG